MKLVTDNNSYDSLLHTKNNQWDHTITLTEDTTLAYLNNDVVYSSLNIQLNGYSIIIDIDMNKLWKQRAITLTTGIVNVKQCPIPLKVTKSTINPNITCNQISIEYSSIHPTEYDHIEDPNKIVQKMELNFCKTNSVILSAKSLSIDNMKTGTITLINNDTTKLTNCNKLNIIPNNKNNIQIDSSKYIQINGDNPCFIWINDGVDNLNINNPNVIVKSIVPSCIISNTNVKYDPIVKYNIEEAMKVSKVSQLLKNIITCNTNVSQIVRLIKKLNTMLHLEEISFAHINPRIIDAILYNNSKTDADCHEHIDKHHREYSPSKDRNIIQHLYQSMTHPLKSIWLNHINNNTIKLIDNNTVIKLSNPSLSSLTDIVDAIPDANIDVIRNIVDSLVKTNHNFNILDNILDRSKLYAPHAIFINRLTHHATELLKKGIKIKLSIPKRFININSIKPYATTQLMINQWANMNIEFFAQLITKENIYEILNHKFKNPPLNLFQAIVSRKDIIINLDIITQVKFINYCMKYFPKNKKLMEYAYELYVTRKDELEEYISIPIYTLIKLKDFSIVKKFNSNHNRIKLTKIEKYLIIFNNDISGAIKFINNKQHASSVTESKSLTEAVKEMILRPILDIDNISYRIGQQVITFYIEDWTKLPKNSHEYERLYDVTYTIIPQSANQSVTQTTTQITTHTTPPVNKIPLTTISYTNMHKEKTIIFNFITSYCESYFNNYLVNDAQLMSVYWFIVKMKEIYPDYKIIAIDSNHNSIFFEKTLSMPNYSSTHDFILNNLFQLSDISYPAIESKFVDHVQFYTPNHIF